MRGLGREQMIEVAILVAGLVVSFAVMSVHHPYTATILGMAAAFVAAGHIVLVGRR
jgi:uncharacterized membrane protein